MVAICGIAGSLIPVPGAGKAMKFSGKAVTKIIGNAPDLMKKVKMYPTKYHTRTSEQIAVLRKEFERTVRKNFIKEYSYSEEAVKRFSAIEREMMKNGEMPKDWTIYHKHPLLKGGDNDFSNWRIMKKLIHNKYRKRLHYYEEGKNIYKLD